jgi:hypothetical protein
MFERAHTDAEARRAQRMESIYHLGQARSWNGRETLAALVEQHGRPQLAPEIRGALGRVLSLIMWGELAAWKISAQLVDALEPLEAKMAASAQVHDEARHFYVMHDYLELIGEPGARMDGWSKRLVELTLGTDDLAKKLLGMQLTIETIALTLFQKLKELDVEPILSDLMVRYEKDEARHVGLGVQLLPALLRDMSRPARLGVVGFHLQLLVCSLAALKGMEKDLRILGVDPREVLAIGFRRQNEIDTAMRAEFSFWPDDPPVRRIFGAMCEVFFPAEGPDVEVPITVRIAHAYAVIRRERPAVQESWA